MKNQILQYVKDNPECTTQKIALQNCGIFQCRLLLDELVLEEKVTRRLVNFNFKYKSND